MADTNERIARMARMAERLREHAASVNDDECRDSWTQEAADIDWLIARATATPPADAELADVLRLIDEQFGHAADVGATYIAFTQEETKRIAAALRARAVPEVPDAMALPTGSLDHMLQTFANGWNACRDAMLAASKEEKT